jgi:hypothetical protein
MFVAGAGVKGGSYYVSASQGWKSLGGDLESDLHVTTDYRDVLAEIVSTRFSVSTSHVFPGFTPEAVGVMQGA